MTPGNRLFTSDEIRPLAERSDLWGAWLVLHCWGVIAAAMALFLVWPNPLTLILAVMIIGSRQLGLAILMHEAAHNALFKSRRLNERVGDWLCGRPILADLPAYRRYHLKHHRHTQTDEDPDLVLSAPFPTTKSSLRRKIIRDLTGRTGIKLRAQQLAFAFKTAFDPDIEPDDDGLSQAFAGPSLGKSLIANAVLLALFTVIGAWWWYPVFWLLPLLTWYQLVVRIRNIAEHGAVERTSDPMRNTRTTLAGPLMRAFVAPYWVNYHLEHHLVMHMPCRNLPRLHDMLMARGAGGRMQIGRSYADVLRLASSRPEQPG